MRDLVETVIAQVMKKDPWPVPVKRHAPERITGIHKPAFTASGAAAIEKPVRKHQDERLWKASLKFEALFTQQMLATMQKSVPKSGLLPGGFAEDVHNAMFERTVAEAISKQGSIGIADSIYRQLSRSDMAQKSESRTRHAQVNMNSSDKQIQRLEKVRIHAGR